MKDFDYKKSIVTRDNLTDCSDFIEDFCRQLKQYPQRITASKEETITARMIRDRLQRETGAKVRMEAYRSYPLMGRGVFPIIGIWYMICLVFYFVSFAGDKTAGIIISLFTLSLFTLGIIILFSLFLGNKRFKVLLPQKVSYNVVSQTNSFKNDQPNKKTIIIATNHDANLGSFLSNFGLSRKLALIIAPISIFLFMILCFLKAVIGTESVAATIVFSIFGAIVSIVGIIAIITHFSPFPQHSRESNGISTSIAMAVYSYFVEQNYILDDDIQLVFASFGGEYAGHGGSKAFVKAHPEFLGAKVICVGDILSDHIQVADQDLLRKITYSNRLNRAVVKSSVSQGIACENTSYKGLGGKVSCLHGQTINAFSKSGMEATMLFAKDYSEMFSIFSRNDVEQMFALTVGSVIEIAKICNGDDYTFAEDVEIVEDIQEEGNVDNEDNVESNPSNIIPNEVGMNEWNNDEV